MDEFVPDFSARKTPSAAEIKFLVSQKVKVLTSPWA